MFPITDFLLSDFWKKRNDGKEKISIAEIAENENRLKQALEQLGTDYPFMHLLYSQLLVCQRVCLQNTVCLICK